MNGNIMMESAGVAGQGSTFTFTLEACVAPFTNTLSQNFPVPSFSSFPTFPTQSPRSPQSPHSELSPRSSLCTVPASPRWLVSTTHIFIIDDLPIACEILKKRLSTAGFVSIQVVPPGNIKESLDYISHFISNLTPTGNKKILIFCNVDRIVTGQSYPLLSQPNVAVVLMGYIPPQYNLNELPKFEFLRKPVKQSAFIRCLREIWCRFFGPSLSSPTISNSGLPRVSSNNSVSISPPASSSSPLNILVVEDNEINQKVVRRVFKHLNYNNIPVANHGQEALDFIEKHGIPDLILMDVQMPVLDGIETTKIIRKKYTNSDWPYIVSLTADAFPEDRKNCLDAGMNDFLTKPVRVEQVQAILQKCYQLKEILLGTMSK